MHSIVLLLLVAIARCKEIDVNTFSNYLDVQITHLHIEWLLQLDNQKIQAVLEYTLAFQKSGVSQIFLDIDSLQIDSIKDVSSGLELSHLIDDPQAGTNQGQRLTITLAKAYSANDALKIRIFYKISSPPRGIFFVDKAYTSTKSHPFLYTQGQDSNCRALAPLQDTPAVKQTYTATILWENVWTAGNIDVFMSSVVTTEVYPLIGTYTTSTLSKKYFKQVIPIPSYLLAMVAGNIKKVATGSRTFVIAEPDTVNDYAAELADQDAYLAALESYIGPYLWGEYVIAIIQPSFPYFAMENVQLTISDHSIMTKSKKKAGLETVVHEMAHSWFGNTVTCVNWSNLWLNEGMCTFLERKGLMAFTKLTNPLLAADNYQLDLVMGDVAIQMDVEEHGADSNYTSLHPDTVGVNPDVTLSQIPYEKGFLFMVHLEKTIGETLFQQLMQGYVRNFQYKSVDEADFKAYILSYLGTAGESVQKINEITNMWQSWVYGNGMPPKSYYTSTPALESALALAKAYVQAAGSQPATWKDYQSFSFKQQYIFLNQLDDEIEEGAVDTLTQINKDHNLDSEDFTDLKSLWLSICLGVGDRSRDELVRTFVSSYGRPDLIMPIYEILSEIDSSFAWELLEANRGFYHPETVTEIEELLNSSRAIMIVLTLLVAWLL